ncbi:hypothetical protein OROHE_010753 [Orobanche hederae]
MESSNAGHSSSLEGRQMKRRKINELKWKGKGKGKGKGKVAKKYYHEFDPEQIPELSRPIDAKYICPRRPGEPPTKSVAQYFRALARSHVDDTPSVPMPRNHSMYGPSVELAEFAIQSYNKHHRRTKFEVVDLMTVMQSCCPAAIIHSMTFTAKNVKVNGRFPTSCDTFTCKVFVHRPSGFKEVEFCDREV